jgi:cobalt/nickel transport system permease protein
VRHLGVVDRWSQASSVLHARDPRAKLAVLLIFLIAVSTTAPAAQLVFAGYAALLLAAAVVSRLPVGGLIVRAALVLPFSATFALLTWWAGDGLRALSLAEKSYLSGFAAVLLVATTPLPSWTAALDRWRCPRPLILVIQFLYRYLFVIAEQALRMRLAAQCRGGIRFQAAGGAIGVLFARSWERADGVYQAMLARGFRGRFTIAALPPFRAADALFLTAAAAAAIAIRLAL